MREVDDRVGEANALHRIGVVHHREARLDLAETTPAQTRALASHTCERVLEGQVCHALADVALAGNDRVQARQYLRAAAHLFRESRSSFWHGRTLALLSELEVPNPPAQRKPWPAVTH